MVEDITLVKANYEDIDFLYLMISELENKKFDFDIFKKNVMINLNNTDIEYYKIRLKNIDCGIISLYFNNLIHHNGLILEIQEFVITEEQRGRGLGEEVLRVIGEIAKERNVIQIEVCTNKERTRTQSFYKNCGFNETHYKYTMKMMNMEE